MRPTTRIARALRVSAALVPAPMLALALLAACGVTPAGRQIAVQAGTGSGKMFFSPNQVTLRPGEPVVFVVKNLDLIDHEFESDELGFGEITIPAGRSRTVPVTAPAKPGSYEIVCDLPGHKEAGMLLRVEVQ